MADMNVGVIDAPGEEEVSLVEAAAPDDLPAWVARPLYEAEGFTFITDRQLGPAIKWA